MGSEKKFLTCIVVIIVITLCSSVDLSSQVSYFNNVTELSLDDYFYKNALENIPKPDTGKLYDVSLPANLSEAAMSFSRIKSKALWRNGSNHTYFTVPHWTLAWPITAHVDMVYYNLGNLSNSYFGIENHTFVAPVLGLLAYFPTPRNYTPVELKVIGEDDSIVVRFHNVSLGGINGMRAVRFDNNGTLEFSEVAVMEGTWSCVFQKIGHYSIVVPNEKDNRKKYNREEDDRERRGKGIKRLAKIAIGVVCGLLVLVLIVAFGVWGWRRWNERGGSRRRERMTELEVALDTIWVGRNNICVRT